MDELCRSLQLETVEDGDVVIRQNDVGDKMYIILSGSCEVRMRQRVELAHGESEMRDKSLFICTAGTNFGEKALMNDEPRAASIIAKETTDLIVITKFTYIALLKSNVSDNNAMAAKMEQPGTKAHLLKVLSKRREFRTKLEVEAVAGYLKWRIPFFRKFTSEQLLELCRVSEAVSIWGETVLFKQGTTGQAFYVILTGSVEVWVASQEELQINTAANVTGSAAALKGSAKNVLAANALKAGLGNKVAMLSVGDFFGERALENDDSLRMASICTCESLTDLLVISREDYHKLVSALTNQTLMNKITVLRRTDVFRNMDATHLKELARFMEPKRYDIDDKICVAGNKATQMVITHVGEVMVEVDVQTFATTKTITKTNTDFGENETSETNTSMSESNINNNNNTTTATALVTTATSSAVKEKEVIKAKIGSKQKLELGRLAPYSVIAPYITQVNSIGEVVIHPETVIATTLVMAYTVGLHDFYTHLNRETKSEVAKTVRERITSTIPSLWETDPLRLGEKDYTTQMAWKKYKKYLIDKQRSLTYNESLQMYSNIHFVPGSGNKHQNSHGAINGHLIGASSFLTDINSSGNKLPDHRGRSISNEKYGTINEGNEVIISERILNEGSTHSDAQSIYYTDELEFGFQDDDDYSDDEDPRKSIKVKVDKDWGLPIDKSYLHRDVSEMLGFDVNSTHPSVSNALKSAQERAKQRKLDTLRGKSALLSRSTNTKKTTETLTTNVDYGGAESQDRVNENLQQYPFSLLHYHQESIHVTPASTGLRRMIKLHLRHCGTMKSCNSAKSAATSQMQEVLLKMFDSDLSKSAQLSLKWRAFGGFESMALNNPDIFVIYCRSVPVEYACLTPEKDLLQFQYPSFCKPKNQFYACLVMKSITIPKVALPEESSTEIWVKKRRRPKKIDDTVGVEYDDTDDEGSADEMEKMYLDKTLNAAGLSSGSQYKGDKFKLQLRQPLLLQELSSFHETMSTTVSQYDAVKFAKAYEAQSTNIDPFKTLTGNTSLKTLTGSTSLPNLFPENSMSSSVRIGSASSAKNDYRRSNSRASSRPGSRPAPDSRPESRQLTQQPPPLKVTHDVKSHVCIFPLYEWIVLSQETLKDYDITQLSNGENNIGVIAPKEQSSKIKLEDRLNQIDYERRIKLMGKDSVNTAFTESGMTSTNTAAVASSGTLQTLKASASTNMLLQKPNIDIIEKDVALKGLTKIVENVYKDRVEEEKREKERERLEKRRNRFKSNYKPPNRESAKSNNTEIDNTNQGESPEKLLSFVQSEEKEKALSRIIQERQRIIEMNRSLCEDEQALRRGMSKRLGKKIESDSDSDSDRDDDSSAVSGTSKNLMKSFSTSALDSSKQSPKKRIMFKRASSNSGNLEPGGMGLLKQRMNMYENLNSLHPNRNVVEKILKNENTIRRKKEKQEAEAQRRKKEAIEAELVRKSASYRKADEDKMELTEKLDTLKSLL